MKYFWLKLKKKIFSSRFNSRDFVEYLRLQGIKIGKGTYFFGPSTTVVDIQRPMLLEIGEYCKITAGVKILTHDYSRSVLRRKYGEIVGEAKMTKIGNNVFIGLDSILLPGVTVGDNVIIGAGSVVTRSIPDDCVVAGNPAKVICSLDEYFHKRKSKYIGEAKEYVRILRARDVEPTVQNMGAFFPIFLPRERELLEKYRVSTDLNGDEQTEVIEGFLKSEPAYLSFEEFLKDCERP